MIKDNILKRVCNFQDKKAVLTLILKAFILVLRTIKKGKNHQKRPKSDPFRTRPDLFQDPADLFQSPEKTQKVIKKCSKCPYKSASFFGKRCSKSPSKLSLL